MTPAPDCPLLLLAQGAGARCAQQTLCHHRAASAATHLRCAAAWCRCSATCKARLQAGTARGCSSAMLPHQRSLGRHACVFPPGDDAARRRRASSLLAGAVGPTASGREQLPCCPVMHYAAAGAAYVCSRRCWRLLRDCTSPPPPGVYHASQKHHERFSFNPTAPAAGMRRHRAQQGRRSQAWPCKALPN